MTLLPTRPSRWDRPVAPLPDPVFTQDEQRDRRRHHLTVLYGKTFRLDTEVAAITGPLGYEVSQLPQPIALRRDVDAVANAAHELLSTVVGMLAESKHADRDQTVRAVADLARRPREPVIGDDHLVSGSWSALLVAHVEPFAHDLSALLDHALPPDAEGLRGRRSASERLVAALRVLDRAATDLNRRLPGVRHRQSLPSMEEHNREQRAQEEQRRVADALARMGATP